jgi:hypothetical protein
MVSMTRFHWEVMKEKIDRVCGCHEGTTRLYDCDASMVGCNGRHWGASERVHEAAVLMRVV